MPTESQEIREYNTRVIAEAKRNHRTKLSLLHQITGATRTIYDRYIEDGEIVYEIPDEITLWWATLQRLTHEIERSKEYVDLLGQDVEEYRVILPDYIVEKDEAYWEHIRKGEN